MSEAACLLEIKSRIESAVHQFGRQSKDVRLMAVSKTYPADVISRVAAAGHILFGENRVQELLEKAPQLPAHLEWHLIGPLQRNKIRKVVGLCACIQTIDSLKLARAVSRVGSEEGLTQEVLLQLRIGGEESKSGFDREELLEGFEELQKLPNLNLAGIMTIPPPTDDFDQARRFFAEARGVRDLLSTQSGLPLAELSMGMSGDFEAAIAEGSTMVRVGSAIFGKRSVSR